FICVHRRFHVVTGFDFNSATDTLRPSRELEPRSAHGLPKLTFAGVVTALVVFTITDLLPAQTTVPSTRLAHHSLAYATLRGRKVEDIRVMGNTQVSTAIILNMVRTK